MLAAKSSPETVLNVVSALATVVGTLAAALTLIFAGPRYRLLYGPRKCKQLKDGSWKVSFYLSSRGRRDITREAFDECLPVELDLGVRIRDIADIWSSRPSARMVKVRADGRRLLVGPSLIGRRQDLRFTVIAEAKPPSLACQASLVDVAVRRQRLAPKEWSFGVAFASLLAGVFVGWVVSKIVKAPASEIINLPVLVSGGIIGIGALAWHEWRFRDYPKD
jgi:hypothetical protein